MVKADAAKAAAISGSNIMKLEVGENIVRFVPPRIGEPTLRMTGMHYIDAVPGLDKLLVFACPRIELKVPCPACEKSEEMSKSPNKDDRERAFQLSSQFRAYAAVVDRSVEDPVEGLKVLAFGKMVHTGLNAIRNNPRLGGDFTDPSENGFDVIITREGTGKTDTRYSVAADRRSSILVDDAEVLAWLVENRPDLDALVHPVVPEELRAAWESMRAPTARRSSPRIGAQLMVGRRPAASAVTDAKGVEYDDDFNEV
jgi:hypothetical protein